jgi:ABC-type multidrug transport system ATPase subunit
MSELNIRINSYKIGKWRATTLLQDLEIKLTVGEITGLLGRNGCGKSSLMRIIFGKYKADVAAHFDGTSIDLKAHLKHQLVAYLPQDPFLIESSNVVDTVQMWYPDPQDQDRILYEPLVHKIHNVKVGRLSVGERRFLEFLLVIYTDRPFVLLDEPFSMLAPIQIERVKEIIQQRKSSKGILLSDHYFDNVLNIADRTLALKNSKLTVVETMAHLKQQDYI